MECRGSVRVWLLRVTVWMLFTHSSEETAAEDQPIHFEGVHRDYTRITAAPNVIPFVFHSIDAIAVMQSICTNQSCMLGVVRLSQSQMCFE